MRVALFTPLAVSAVLAIATPWAGGRLPPRLAAWLLTLASLVAAVGTAIALGMMAFTLIAQIPAIAAEGEWSPGLVAAHTPVIWPVAVVCALALAGCLGSLVSSAWRQGTMWLAARRESRALPTDSDMTVVDDPVPHAFALPGSPGRIVVSSGMLRALSAEERSALLAHERAHLRHRHHLFLLVLCLAAALNPMLRPVARAGSFAVERWADEEAGTLVGDRPLVARAVARAALAAKQAPRHSLAATGGPVPQRVRALLAPPPPFRRDLVVAHALLMVICCSSLALSANDMDRLFDTASPGHLHAAQWRHDHHER
ncbi:M56 family metallopeptidase [Streptomyces violascens]|uniref:Peptidase M48 n=1 Tax=Streptomyces violascens TaxID=67381 RepID=A0ABQ3QRF6_9ACTN|nr:M56 family metallopeptidase [Streptomyces violascens]GGU48813.1 peptidase M48 [Streptomyces violascens]GHI39857.1 peptidase M48 [Streptomyces violascens]